MVKKSLLAGVFLLCGCVGHEKPGTLSYPAHAWAVHVAGEVDIMYNIEPDGSTSDVHMLREQPTGFFALNAIHDIQKWKYPSNHPKKHIVLRIQYVLPQVKYSSGAKPITSY